ncbi:gliding motility-associated C-terminal domain-containing protein [Chitinophaga sp. CF118]|uniref:PKD domain-containing protein n=1 Tax=Chitinophaga sp. CF118 TaxID=1884367 RepID=UPI0008F0690D|nr:PKD domain-containing protein [Chitinophaga sp. CF118]SFE41281.1 gliding motility-associated C-terminal domain-containing protein [Chitinophaga sp. CF118]
MNRTLTTTLLAVFLFSTKILLAQTFIPVPVTGFNSDIVAEAGNNAVAVTSTVIDGSNHVIYTTNFATLNGVTGGITNTGNIVSGTRTYQMAPYTANNAIYMSAAGNVANSTATGTFTLTTPAAYNRLSLLAFGTENNSVVSVTLHFTDGTTSAGGNITIKDWFNGTPFLINGMGRITRVTGAPYTVDGLTTNPRMYSFDFVIPCADKGKLLQSVTFNYIPGANISSRALLMALSGEVYSPVTITDVVTNAICGGANGSIALTVTGGSSPFTYSWNTNPTKTTATATNLPAGTYICAIKDANSCIINYQGTIIQKSLASITAAASPALICAGQATALTATASGGTVTGYAWNPGNISGDNTSVSPTSNTSYIVTAKDAFGCTVADTVDITVKPTPTANFTIESGSICLGISDTLTFTGTAGPTATFNWNNFAGATYLGTDNAGHYQILFTNAGTYTLQLQVTENGCVSAPYTQQMIVTAPPSVSLQVSKTPLCAGEITTVTFTGNASNAAIAKWNWGGGVVQSGSGFGPYNVKYQRSGNIDLTVTDGACTATATAVPVTVIPMPVADFTPDFFNGCAPSYFEFNNQSQNANSYKWIWGDGSTSTAVQPNHTYTTPGTYTVTLIAGAQQQCYDTLVKTALLTVVAQPVASFTSQPGTNIPIEYKNATFNFTNTSQNAVTYKWDFGDGNTSTDANPEYKWELPGNYWVTLFATNSLGCVDTIGHGWYKVIPDLVLDIPNVFSPNGDGINDRWNLDGLKARPGCLVEVYNRWGQTVYRSEGYILGWDGTRQGKLVSPGTYYYVIKTAPGEKTYTGWVLLLR